MAGSDGSADDNGSADAEEFAARVRTAEGQPLEERASAFGDLHDELRTRLEGGGGSGV